jgi:SAM-dependent methyltransferase
MKRVVIPELLDTDSGTPAEVVAALSDLRRINRWLGGIAATEGMVGRVAREIVRQRVGKRGLRLDVTLLDRAQSHLRNGNRAVVGDALALPFRDASFDLLCCNLFAHHLSPQELLQFVEDALRVCRIAVLIDDIVRHPLHLALVYAGLPLYRSRMTRHDAPASVRQAYTSDEMRTLLAQTKAARVEIHPHYLFRMGVTAWK